MGQIDPSALLQTEALLKFSFDGASCNTLERKKKASFRASEARPGIQSLQMVISSLDSGFHRSDDFLRNHKFFSSLFRSNRIKNMERNLENYVKKSIAWVYNFHVKWSILHPPFSVFFFLFITCRRSPFDFRLA